MIKRFINRDYMKTVKYWFMVLTAALLPCHTISAEVVTVSNPNGGAILSELQSMGVSIQNVDSLIVTGTLNDNDYAVLKDIMTNLKWLDISGTGITEIPDHAFHGSDHLVDLIVPPSLVSFGASAFESCHNLSSVSGADNVMYIGDGAFLWSGLTTLPFGDKIVSIDGRALYDTKIKGDIVFPETLKSLGGMSFLGTSITTVDLSKTSINRIEEWAFSGCRQLKHVVFPENQSVSIGRLAFSGDPCLTRIVIPENVTDIAEQAFTQDENYDSTRVFIFYSQIPVNAQINSFTSVYDDNLTLLIPKGSLKTYRESKGYLMFGKIFEHGFSIKVDGNGYIKYLDSEYADGSVCMPVNDSLPKSFSFIPAPGNEIASVTLDDSPVILTDNAYTVGVDTITGSISVKFVPKSLQLAVTCTAGGVVKYNGSSVSNGATINANGGEVVKLSFTPDDGCFVKSVKFNGLDVVLIDGELVYETPVLIDNATISVEFGTPQELDDYIRVNVNSHGSGVIQCDGNTVNSDSYILVHKGDSLKLKFVPGEEGYVESLLVNSFEMVSDIVANTLTLRNLSQDVELKADFFSAVDVLIDSPNGKLNEKLSDAGIIPIRIKYLKLTGIVTENDLSVINQMLILQTLDLSETTLTEIPAEVFKDMDIYKVMLPSTVVKVGERAFSGCSFLKVITGYENIKRLERGAFYYCGSLTSFPFGDKIEAIGAEAFEGCNSLPKTVVMYPSLKEYGGFAFRYDGIDTIDLSKCTFENTSFGWYPFHSARCVYLPEKGNYNIGDLACSLFKSIIIPSAVTSVGEGFIKDASELKDIYMRSSVPPSGNFSGSNMSSITLHVPAGSAELYGAMRSWSSFGTIEEYGIGVKSNGHGVIYADGKRLQSDTPLFPDGDEMIISLLPDPGYEVTQVLLDDSILTAGLDGSYVIPAGRETGTFTVGWKLKRFGITVNYQGGGSVMCAGRELTNGEVIMTDSASVVRFDIAPANGYLVKDISFNGVESVVQNGGTVYVTPSITGASTLDLTFAEQSGVDGVFQFDITTGNNGSVVYKNTTLLSETSVNISAGQNAVFELNPQKYYRVAKITYNGEEVTADVVDGKYQVNNVAQAATITVSFCLDTKATVTLTTEGTLGSSMFQALKDTVEWLIVKGPMNDADFGVIRSELPHLLTLDLSGADITYIPERAFYNEPANIIENVILPATVNSISREAFRGCMLKSLTVNTSIPFEIGENAFSQYALKMATVYVPSGSELSFRNDSRWSSFEGITDGVINNVDDRFEKDGFRYVVTDLENKKVQAIIRSVAEYDSLPVQVQIDGLTFAVQNAKLESMDSKGYIMLLADGSIGPWEGKYWYSAQKNGSGWQNAPADDWMNLDFDDSGWTVFAGPIKTNGYGGYTDWKGDNDCYWVRRSFQLDNLDSDKIKINMSVDDDIELYINGINVHNGSYSGGTGEITVSASCLKLGENVVAAKVINNVGPGFVDFSFKVMCLVIDGLKYEFSDMAEDEVILTGSSAPIRDLFVPSTISFIGNTYKVTAIADLAFKGDTTLVSVSGMDNIKTIGAQAFENCALLEQVSIPEGVQSIEFQAFSGCYNIQGKVTLPSSLTDLGAYVFYGCKNITSINIPAGIKVIQDCSFENCSSLFNVEFNEGLVMIGGGAFRRSGIVRANLPSTLKEIGNESFNYCSSLSAITLKRDLATIGDQSFAYCSVLNSVEIPSSVTVIKHGAFARCNSLETAVLSEGLIDLGEWAFGECVKLKTVNIPSTVRTMGGSVFGGCYSLEKVKISEGITCLEDGTFSGCAIDSIIIPSTVRILKNDVFSGCHNLTYVKLPENMMSIGGCAFSGCINLVSIDLPQNLISIGSGAFMNDSRLSDIIIPESVSSINNETFCNCRSISMLTIPSTIGSIGINALRGISYVKMESSIPPAISSTEQFDDFTAIVVPDGAYDTYCNAPYWKEFKSQFTFEENLNKVVHVEQDSASSNLSVVLGEKNLSLIVGLKVIGTINSYDIMIMRNKMNLLRNLDLSEATIVANNYEYYQGCHTEDNVIGSNSFRDLNLSSVILPNNIKRIGSGAFYKCQYLSGIVIPDAVEYIESSAFKECRLLKTAYIGDGVKSIDSDAFRDCDNLLELRLGKNVSAIGGSAFHSCDNLKYIEFGNKLLYISGGAFSDCFSLTDVTLPGNLIEIGEGAFKSCSKLKEIKIPSSVKSIRENAFGDCPLEKVYTYTIEPTNINQNTFSQSVYKTAKLYVPATSYYNYYWNTQWSQFSELIEFDEPYEFFYLNGDYELTQSGGRIDGTPDMEMNETSGITIEGDSVQTISEIELNYNANNGVGASIIAGDGNTNNGVVNLTAVSMNVNIGIDGGRWYFFCFPFDVARDSIECTSDYVFYSYNGLNRAQGLSGWTKVGNDVTALAKSSGYIFQSSHTGILTIHVGQENLQFSGKNEKDVLHSYEAGDMSDASWNFLGNPFISYYDVQDLAKEYDSPIIIWNGTGYEAYKPGDDNYQLKPFEAFFVQKESGKSFVEFLPENRLTYNQAATISSLRVRRRAEMGTPMSLDRQLVNIVLMGQDSISDRTRIVYSTKASLDYEIGVDAAKFHTDGIPEIYTVNGTTKYAINERPMGTDDIKLGYIAPKGGTYTLSVPRHDAEIEIYDNETRQKVDFTFGDYQFTTKAGTYNDRFVIHKTSGGVTAVDNGFRLDGMTVTAFDGGIDIEGQFKGKIQIYSESGMLMAEPKQAGRVQLDGGVYIIKIGDKSIKMNVML